MSYGEYQVDSRPPFLERSYTQAQRAQEVEDGCACCLGSTVLGIVGVALSIFATITIAAIVGLVTLSISPVLITLGIGTCVTVLISALACCCGCAGCCASASAASELDDSSFRRF